MADNGFTTAADYKRMLEQHVELPSGATFLLRRPTLRFRLAAPGIYQTIALRTESRDYQMDDEKVKQIGKLYYDILCECCVHPVVSITPKEGELHPDDIQMVDALFIARWAGGEVDAQGADLAEFRKQQRGSSPIAGESGPDISLPSQLVVGD